MLYAPHALHTLCGTINAPHLLHLTSVGADIFQFARLLSLLPLEDLFLGQMDIILHLPFFSSYIRPAYCLLIKMRADGALGRVIAFLAPATFGIYLFADFVCTNTHLIYWNMCRFMNRLFAVAVQDVAAIAAALCIVLLLRLIPPVRRWI